MPALQCHDIQTPVLTSVRGKRHIKTKPFKDCITSNIVERQSTNNTKCSKLVQCNSEIYRNSFFPKTVIDWNHTEESAVRAKTVDGSSGAVSHWDLKLQIPALFARMPRGSATYRSISSFFQ